MPRTRNPIPSYLPHKQSGRARAVWSDQTGTRRFRLLPGPFDSPESRSAFAALVLELDAAPHHAPAADPGGLTLAQLLLAYLEHAERHYRTPDGRPTSEIYEVKIVVRALRELYADRPVAEFGPLCVKAARQRWVTEGRSRTECNRRVALVKRIFKWAVAEELAPPAVYQAVAAVAGLQKGRTTAREIEPVGPVDDAVVDAALPYLNRHVRGLVEFQRLTGCRPGEACTVRRCDLDTGGPTWLYKPSHHKTAHRGKARVIALGPKAQALL
jgi:integrase